MAALSKRTRKKWMQRFKEGDIEVHDKTLSRKKFNDERLKELLDEYPAQTLKELSISLDKSTVSKRLHALGKVQKEKCLIDCQKDRS